MLNWTCKYCESANGQQDNTCKSCGAEKPKEVIMREQVFMNILAEPRVQNIYNIQTRPDSDVVMVYNKGQGQSTRIERLLADVEETEFEFNRPGRWYYQTWIFLDDYGYLMALIIVVIIALIAYMMI
jgi:hypothetical protein